MVILWSSVAGLGAEQALAIDDGDALRGLGEARELYEAGQYFKAARYAFGAVASQSAGDRKIDAEAYSWITLSLVRAGLENSASYFFIRTLQLGQVGPTRRVLSETQNLMSTLGADLLRKYLIRHTRYEDYDLVNRGAYLYALAKDALLAGDANRAIGYVNGIETSSAFWPFALQIRAVAFSLQGKLRESFSDFEQCEDKADQIPRYRGRDWQRALRSRREREDLEARCQAGQARVLYEMGRFEEADRAYDAIAKSSYVWPDILFEHAWNSFARREYNRSLGKLVSYKAPALGFVYNSEAEVLKAQSYLALCLYNDANEGVNEFNSRYARMGEQVKALVESGRNNMSVFYDAGRAALRDSIYTKNETHRMMNRFIRGPYFQNLVANEREIDGERGVIREFDAMQPGVSHEPGTGFPGFLGEVLNWRARSIRQLGGAFVKNSLIDYHAALLADFDKIAFIKLEMLKRAKDALLKKISGHSASQGGGERDRGNVSPNRRDDQLYWDFNGEFWNDELGDYVFGLESECEK